VVSEPPLDHICSVCFLDMSAIKFYFFCFNNIVFMFVYLIIETKYGRERETHGPVKIFGFVC
jgi:hypothetical protein